MKKKFFSFLGILLFFIVWLLSYISNNISGYKLNIWYDEYGNEFKIPIIKELKGDSLILKTSFSKNNSNFLILPEISGNYAEVYLNGRLIATLGFNKKILTNLYLKPFLIKLNNLKEKNILTLKIFDLYKGGIKITPVLINENNIYKFLLLYI